LKEGVSLMETLKKAIAECIGTMVLVIVGCGVAVTTGCSDNAGIVATALAFGLSIVAMAYSIGNISGCHINPAVSFGLFVAHKMSLKDLLVYVGAQIVGAIAGAAILYGIFHNGAYADSALGANQAQSFIGGASVDALGQAVAPTTASYFVALATEIILTFIFVLAILGVTSKVENSHVAGIVIGLTLVLVHLLGIRLTGTSVNPARSIGPALLALANGHTEPIKEIWIFIVGPLAGAGLAGLLFNFFEGKKPAAAAEAK
jgi:aquaporin Z